MNRSRSPWFLLVAVAAAGVVGSLAGESASIAGVPLHGVFDFVGTIFISALKMLVVPLVLTSVIVAVAGGAGRGLRRLGLRAVSLFLLTTILAVLIGLVFAGTIRPGVVDGRPAMELLPAGESDEEMAAELADTGIGNLLDVLLGVVPANVVGAAAGDDLLGLMFFAALFGYFVTRLDDGQGQPLLQFCAAVSAVMSRMTSWVMRFAPIGVFGLVAHAFAKSGAGTAGPLAALAGVTVLALATHAFLVLPALLLALARVSPLALYRGVAPAVAVALASGSSVATLPATMDCLVRRAGVSPRVASLVLPVGAVVNMNGTALYAGVASVFLAQAYGLELDIATQFIVMAIAVVACIGLPGIPSGSIVAVSIIMSAIGLPADAVGVLLVLDRFMEMARTGVNVLGDAVCAAVVSRLEAGLEPVPPPPDGA